MSSVRDNSFFQILLLSGFFTVSLLSADCFAIDSTKSNASQPTGVVLALSGGGVRGLAHLGVIEEFEANGIPIEGITGTSIGAIIGGLYSLGLSPLEIANHFRNLQISSMMFDAPERRTLLLARKEEQTRDILSFRLSGKFEPVIPGAISPGQRLYINLLNLTLSTPYHTETDWSRLRPPLCIVTTDLSSGNPTVYNSGDVTAVIRGSLAIPLLFDPMQYDGKQLIDGGISENLPVKTARSCFPDGLLIAVDASTPLWKPTHTYQPWEVVDRVITILEAEELDKAKAAADILIQPDLGEISNMTSFPVDSLIELGRSAARKAIPQIRKQLASTPKPAQMLNLPIEKVVFHGDVLLEDSVQTACYEPVLNLKSPTQSQLDACHTHLLRKFRQNDYPFASISATDITETTSGTNELHISTSSGRLAGISFEGLDQVPVSWLRREIPLVDGEPISLIRLQRGIANLYATNLFRIITPLFSLDDAGDWIITMQVTENPSAIVRLGLNYFGEHNDTQGERLTRGFAEILYPSPFNYAARMVLFASFGSYDKHYKTSFLADRIFGKPLNYNLSFYRNSISRPTYDNHQETGEFISEYWGGSFNFGGTARSWGLLEFTSRFEHRTADSPTNDLNYHTSAVGTRLALDTEDSSPFPDKGIKAVIEGETATGILGADLNYHKLNGYFEAFNTPIIRTTLGMRLSGATADRLTPEDEQFRLGGIHSFPGLHLDELFGTFKLTGGVETRYDLISRVLADAYIGFRYDIGGIWDDPEPQLTKDDWMQSASSYIAFDTLLGPIMIQWSILFEPGKLSRQDIIYVQLGNNF